MTHLRTDDLREWDPAAHHTILTLDDIFEEEPVPLDVFIKDKKFLWNPPLSEVQFEAVRHIERIYYDGWFSPVGVDDPDAKLPKEYDESRDTYALMAQDFHPYWSVPTRMCNFITLQWGKGSGKDHICRVASLRIAYLLQCLRSPQFYYEMPPQDTIHMLNVASSSPQAMQAFFMPITRVVKTGWFKDKCDPKPGLGIVTWEKNVEMLSGHADAESQEGMNLILGVADEIDAFKTKDAFMRNNQGREPTKSAEGILKMLRTSASTRFPETFKNVRISYPRYLGSTIQKLTAQARKDNERNPEKSRHYVSGPLPTWGVNPRVTGKSAFKEDYDEDPEMARAMYECAPSRAVATYYRNMDAIRMAVDRESQPVSVDYDLGKLVSEVTGHTVPVWNVVYTYDSALIPIRGARYALHADLATTSDRAGVSMSHVESWETFEVPVQDEEGGIHVKKERRPKVRTDFTISLESNMRPSTDDFVPPREIQIRWVRQLVFELIQRGFRIQTVSYDGFQSTDSMQILHSHGITTEKTSTDRDPDIWKTYRDIAYEGRHRMAHSTLLLTELESLGLRMGKVDHPPGGSKDEADSMVCSVHWALQLGGQEDEDGAQAYIGGDQFGQADVVTEYSPDPFVGGMEGSLNAAALPIGFKP